ncbi:MAG: hypothetical protein ACT4PU_06490 [Planctomycetota bacterium]
MNRLLLGCALVSLPVLAAGGQGKASGQWQLPFGPQPGFVNGSLYMSSPVPTPSTSPAYHFAGVLTAKPVPSSTMLAGTIQGTLDDGVGAGPDFLVVGTYSGQLSGMTGTGSFSVQTISPSAATPSGAISGTFTDMLISPTSAPGSFTGRWKIGG